jgi:CDP-alcohol phosphatidyltransferase-like enzyme
MTRPPVPDIAKLRSICQAGKLSKDSRFFYVLSRRVSIYITWLFLHTNVRPNQVTVLTVVLAFVGVCLLAAATPAVAMWGAVCLLGHYFLDKVDGDLARYHKTFSLVGVYLDDVGHSIVYGGLFLGLGLHLARQTRGEEAVIWVLGAGAAGALALVIGKQNKNSGFTLFARNVLTQPELLPERRREGRFHLLSREATLQGREAGPKSSAGAGQTIIARARDGMLLATDYSVMLALVTAGLAIELVSGNSRFLLGVLVFEVVAQAVALVGLVWINSTMNVEAECVRLEALIQRRNDVGRSQ